MLRRLQQHPLLAGAGEVLLDALRYIGIMLIIIILLAQLAKLTGSA